MLTIDFPNNLVFNVLMVFEKKIWLIRKIRPLKKSIDVLYLPTLWFIGFLDDIWLKYVSYGV